MSFGLRERVGKIEGQVFNPVSITPRDLLIVHVELMPERAFNALAELVARASELARDRRFVLAKQCPDLLQLKPVAVMVSQPHSVARTECAERGIKCAAQDRNETCAVRFRTIFGGRRLGLILEGFKLAAASKVINMALRQYCAEPGR